MIGTVATTRISGATYFCQRRPWKNQATMKNGSESERLLPHVLANGNGALGRASGCPRTFWMSATAGWTIDWTRLLLRRPCGSSISIGEVNSRCGASTPSRPPNVVTTNMKPSSW